MVLNDFVAAKVLEFTLTLQRLKDNKLKLAAIELLKHFPRAGSKR